MLYVRELHHVGAKIVPVLPSFKALPVDGAPARDGDVVDIVCVNYIRLSWPAFPVVGDQKSGTFFNMQLHIAAG